MNKKLFFNIVFMTAGTFIVVAMSVIMCGNFIKDGRFFQPSASAATQNVAKDSSGQKQGTATDEEDDDYKTLKYQRPAVPKEKKDPNEAKDADSKDSTKKGKIKVEVINYSGVKRVAEDIRSTLQASGYEVSAGNGESKSPVRTTIIELNDKKAGGAIQGILGAGTIKKSSDPTSRFDVMVIIGDDFRP